VFLFCRDNCIEDTAVGASYVLITIQKQDIYIYIYIVLAGVQDGAPSVA